MITKKTGCNISKLILVKRISKRHVTTLPNAVDGIINYSEIVLEAGEDFEEIPFVANNGELAQPQQRLNDNDYMDISVSIEVAKHRSDVSAQLNEWKYDEHILLVTDANSKTFLAGTKESPCIIDRSQRTPNNPTNLSGYTITFLTKSEDFIPEVDLSS